LSPAIAFDSVSEHKNGLSSDFPVPSLSYNIFISLVFKVDHRAVYVYVKTLGEEELCFKKLALKGLARSKRSTTFGQISDRFILVDHAYEPSEENPMRFIMCFMRCCSHRNQLPKSQGVQEEAMLAWWL
jgi:hypothetical protein